MMEKLGQQADEWEEAHADTWLGRQGWEDETFGNWEEPFLCSST